jgi:precorrin-2 dehydrogenase/sirohydrochlorin ferrochelatase
VIVGGGRVAERKCAPLIRAGADVTVISPGITRRLQAFGRKGVIRHIARSYRKGDISSAFVLIVATDSEETNRKVAADAAAGNILLNVVDNPRLCNFIAPSVLRQGPLTIAVSTGGVSPAMARTIRRELEERYDSRFSMYLRFLKGIRTRAMREIPLKGKRERFLKGLASQELTAILVRKGFEAAREKVLCRLKKLGG